MTKKTVRSHYLPRTYLKHFLHEDQLLMYKKGENFFKDPDPSSRLLIVKGEEGLKNVGLENNIYNPEIEEVSSDDVEEIFNEYGENTYDEVIAELTELPIDSQIPQHIKDKLSLMIAAMRVRTPLFKHEMEQIDESMIKHIFSRNAAVKTAEDYVKEYKEISGEDISLETAEAIRKNFMEKGYTLEYPNGFFLRYALALLNNHADLFHAMTWKIFRPNSKLFITSDNPVVYFVPKEHTNFYVPPKSLASKHCEVFFPLTKNLGAFLTWRNDPERIEYATRKMIDIYNENVSLHSLSFIFSSRKQEFLERYIQSHVPYPFKFTVG